MIDKAGTYDIPFAQYLADPCPDPSLSSSCAHTLIERSPLHAWYRHPRLGGGVREDTNEADIGTIAHDIVLGGEGNIAIFDFPDWRTKAAQEARDEARAAGKTPILSHKMRPILDMAEAAREFIGTSDTLRDAFANGKAEQTVIAREGKTWLRVRPDWLAGDGTAIHYKTSDGSVRPEDFIRGVMQRYGYGFVLAFYQRVMGGGTQLILAQEQNAPYACSLIALTPAKLAIELARVERAIKLWTECMATATWPAYGSRVHLAEPAAWEIAKAEAELLEDEGNG